VPDVASVGWRRIRIQVLVTGMAEKEGIHLLFRPLLSCGFITFEEPQKIDQLSPRSGDLKITGTGKKILPTRDVQLGKIALQFLGNLGQESNILIIVDDLEYDRRAIAAAVFERYRSALDAFLMPKGLHRRASVHFLKFMLEAYYLADPEALGKALSARYPDAPMQAFENIVGDVEEVRHPKNVIKSHVVSFDEIRDGNAILEELDVSKVLSNPDHCRSLRTMFHWCHSFMRDHPAYKEWSDRTDFPGLLEQKLWSLTANQ